MQILGRIVTPNLATAPTTPSPGEMYYDTGLNQLLYWNGTTWVAGSSGGGGGAGSVYEWAPIGAIQSWSRKTLPTGWVLADGATYAESVYPDAANVAAVEVAAGNGLWTITGTAPGRTFTVPNLTDRFIYSRALGNLGLTGGEVNHVLTTAEMPSHVHPPSQAGISYYDSGTPPGTNVTPQVGGALAIHGSPNTGSTGGDGGHNNLPPYVVVAQIVKLSGTTQTGTGTAEVNVSPNGPSPRVGELLWVDSDANDMAWQVPRVTSLPTSPYDGQEVLLVGDITATLLGATGSNVLWRMRWNLAKGKWENAGGSPAVYLQEGQNAAYQAFGNGTNVTVNSGATIILGLGYTPPCDVWFEMEFHAGLVQKTSAEYSLAQLQAQIAGGVPPVGTTTGLSYIQQHSAVQTYEAHHVTKLWGLAAGVPYTMSANWYTGVGTWSYHQGASQLWCIGKAWPR